MIRSKGKVPFHILWGLSVLLEKTAFLSGKERRSLRKVFPENRAVIS